MKKYLVTGGAGKLSSKVIEALLNDLKVNPSDLVTTTRDVSKLSDLANKGVEVRQADFQDVNSLKEAFKDVENLLLISIDQIGKRKEYHTNAINAAQEVGVKHLVYTSMPHPETSPIGFAYEHEATEEALKNSTIANWTILRNNWYFENYIEFYGDTFKTQKWLSAVANGKVAQLSRVDLAYAAASALVKAKDEKSVYTLSGQESLTVDESAAIFNEVLGKNIEVIHVDNKTYKEQLLSFGVPSEIVDMLAGFEEHNRTNLSDFTSEDFEKLTGKKPLTLKEWTILNKENILAL
ncbi:SDR family oxidoreductase [Halarcobacter sp.]|uniref:SDR family oxidoreductase n=1 Tax=Halarcobacter sp. TaxID=2321133 RepID=UPI0029F47DED|nr:SDR family oxidoreductase [Halarcobacter sp.]